MAEQWLQQAEADGDPGWLKRIVDEFFVSSAGDQALLRLGSYALERGDYRHAREYWERISSRLRFPGLARKDRSASEGRPLGWVLRGVDLDSQWDSLAPLLKRDFVARSWLAYPDTDLALADVRARLVMTSILEGDVQRAVLELDLLRRLEPEATGTIGGRSGRYVELLEALLEAEPRSGQCRPRRPIGRRSRDILPAELWLREPIDVGGEPAWSVALPRLDWSDDMRRLDRPARGRIGRRAAQLPSGRYRRPGGDSHGNSRE